MLPGKSTDLPARSGGFPSNSMSDIRCGILQELVRLCALAFSSNGRAQDLAWVSGSLVGAGREDPAVWRVWDAHRLPKAQTCDKNGGPHGDHFRAAGDGLMLSTTGGSCSTSSSLQATGSGCRSARVATTAAPGGHPLDEGLQGSKTPRCSFAVRLTD